MMSRTVVSLKSKTRRIMSFSSGWMSPWVEGMFIIETISRRRVNGLRSAGPPPTTLPSSLVTPEKRTSSGAKSQEAARSVKMTLGVSVSARCWKMALATISPKIHTSGAATRIATQA